MSGGLRKQILLNHLQKVQEVIGETEASGEEEELNDSLGELPYKFKSRSNHVRSISHKEHIVGWEEFFSKKITVELKERKHIFNSYYTLPKHTTSNPSIPVYIFHHGAGSSALTFANLTKELQERTDNSCGCFAFDARGHGETIPFTGSSVKDKPYDRNAFVEDFVAFITYIFDELLSIYPQEKLSIILVGHSLGGSICTFTLDQLQKDVRKQVLGVAMFDIVEEAAIQALQKVQHFLYSTPNEFPSYKDAIDWHVSNNLSRLQESAEIAIPALFKKRSDGSVVRKTDLRMFSTYWDSWFVGLSHQFVSLATCKLLILAGNDNLDRELIIGQMQGKYQLVVFQDSGHFVQEDAPKKCALTLIDFWKRNDNKNVVIKTNWGHK